MASQKQLEISPVAEHPPSHETISVHLEWWQNPVNMLKGSDLCPKDHNVKIFTDASKGALNSEQDFDLRSDEKKRLHKNVLELKVVFLALKQFKVQCQNQTMLVATDNSTLLSYINKRRNPLDRGVCYIVENHDLVPSSQNNPTKQHIPRCLNVMADSLARSNQIQSPEWSLHLSVLKQICQRWFTPHVDLFAICLNHKLRLYVSPVPDQHALETDTLNINWSGLVACLSFYDSPS